MVQIQNEMHSLVPPEAVIEAGGRVVVTHSVPLDGPDLAWNQSLVPPEAVIEAQMDSLEAHAPEEYEPTEHDRRSSAHMGPERE